MPPGAVGWTREQAGSVGLDTAHTDRAAVTFRVGLSVVSVPGASFKLLIE